MAKKRSPVAKDITLQGFLAECRKLRSGQMKKSTPGKRKELEFDIFSTKVAAAVLADKLGYSKVLIGEILEAFEDEVRKNMLAGKPVRLSRVGTFTPRQRTWSVPFNPRRRKDEMGSAAKETRKISSLGYYFKMSTHLKKRLMDAFRVDEAKAEKEENGE